MFTLLLPTLVTALASSAALASTPSAASVDQSVKSADPDSLLTEWTVPCERTRPRRIAITHDGMIWYGDYTRGYLGRLDPKTGDTKEYALPGGAMSLPYGMALDGQGRIWVAETGLRPNRLVAFDPARGMFTDTVEVGGGEVPNSIRHMTYDARTGAIWFGTDRNTIGRLVVRGRETT